MRTGLWCAFIGVVACIFNVCMSQKASAQSFSFAPGGFTTTNVCANSSTPPPACQVLTNGSPSRPQVVSGGILRLTTANTNQHGSAWFKTQQPLASGFTTAFQFQISKTNSCFFCSFPADGLALVIQNDPAATGALGYTGNGQNLSYGNNDVSTASGPGNAILNSLAVELDTHLNSNYSDPDGNHIAVQSCGPNNSSTLTPNSADHNYLCPDGSLAKLTLQSLPAGLSSTDGSTHTITVNYLPPGTCTSACNNLSVYFDSTLILQTTVDISKQLNLTSGTSAYIGFTAATGASVENNDIISWSFSQWPLAPITINQPVQPSSPTNFNYTSALSAVTDYSQSGLPPSQFQGLIMQGSVNTITDQQFSDLVTNTPFQGSTCQHQDTGNGNYACVVTTDLCTTPTNSVATGANCLGTGTDPLINVSNTYNLDPSQKPVVAPGYIMGKDTALNCGAGADNTCKGLVSIFAGMSGDALTSTGKTNNFNSILIPIFGPVQPSTSVTTNPPLNGGWINGSVTVNFNSIETVPSNNTSPPSSMPTISSINYQATGANVPAQASGTLTGASGSITVPVTVEGTTTITYAATDSSNTVETLVTNSGNMVSTSTPTFTIRTDLTAPTLTCTPPAPAWQSSDAVVPCGASDNANGSGLVGPSSFTVQTNVPANTETNNATIPPVTVKDVAGNISAPQPSQGSFGPFWVDKAAPTISGPTISPVSPVFGQAVTASYSCADGGSGAVLCGPSESSQIPPTANTGTLTSPADGSVGTHTYTVTSQDQVGNVSANSSVTYSVGKATPTLTWANPAAITYGTALSSTQLNATASVPGGFAYSPAAGTVLGAGTQTLSVTFTPTDTTDFTAATTAVTLVVNQAKPAITWNTPAAITYGTALTATQLNASASIPGTFVYLPAAGTVLGAGTQTLSVTFTPTDTTDYASASTSVQLTVNKAVPALTWNTPAAITYGTALSVLQLNASANVPGGFVYSPAAGTILSPGVQTLSATFTPTDSADYTTAAKNVSLTVTQAASSTTITAISPNPATPGTPVSFSVSVGGVTGGASPSGTITVKASTGESCSATLPAVGCSITFAAAGSRTVTASYSGDGNYLASSTTGSVTVNVGDFTITATPASQTISSGHQAIYTITVTPVAGLTGFVNLSCSGAPPNSTCSISPSVDNLQGSPIKSTVTLSAKKSCDHGTFKLTFTGTDGNLVHKTSVTLTVKGGGE